MTTFPDDQTATARSSPVVLRLTDVVKEFPGVRALDGVQLEVRAGEVHCLLGQNGAGKSTLIKILAGAHQPDSGRIEWLGEEVGFTNPQAAMQAGIATIYQELDLVEGLSVAENVFLGSEPRRFGFVRRGQMRAGGAVGAVPAGTRRDSGGPRGGSAAARRRSRSSAWRGRCPTRPD